MNKKHETTIKSNPKSKLNRSTKTKQPSVSLILSKEKTSHPSQSNNTTSINHKDSYHHLISKLFKYIKPRLSTELYIDIKEYFKGEYAKMTMNGYDINESLSSVFETQSAITHTEPPPLKNDEKKLKLSYDAHSNIKPKITKVNVNNNSNKIGKELHSMYNISKAGHQLINNNHPCKTQSNSKSKSKSTSRECSSNHTHHQYQLISGNPNTKIVKVKQSLINKSQPLLNGKLFSKINMKPYPKPKFPSTKMQYAQATTQGNTTTIGKKSINNINIILSTNKNKSHSHLTHIQGLYQNTPTNNNNTTGNGCSYSNPGTNVNSHPNLNVTNPSNVNTVPNKMVMSYINHNYPNAHAHTQAQKTKGSGNNNNAIAKKPLITITTSSLPHQQVGQNKTIGLDNRKNTYGDNDTGPIIANSQRNNRPIPLNNITDSDYIELPSQNNNNNKPQPQSQPLPPQVTIKNEELMKEVKNTLEDNLKVMLNFSYENFLSKESESESKNTSLHEMNTYEFNEHYHNQPKSNNNT